MNPHVARRLAPFGQTIFTEISQLAAQHGAINLGQGFPNFDGPDFLREAAIDAIRAGHGQYARMFGVPELNCAIADRFGEDSGLDVDPDTWITVTSGCTEAIAASLIGLINEGDEVVLFEPFYDSYRACVAMAGASPRFVRLEPPEFRLTAVALEQALSSRTRAILVNTPHNPTGRVFDDEELSIVADAARRCDAIVLSDEVYERIVFDGVHRRIATFPGMTERTVTLSSLGKSFSFTGWKIGWAIAPPALTAGVRAAHQFLTFATATPLQHAAAVAMRAPRDYDRELVTSYRARRDLLVDSLRRAGFGAVAPQGTYFVIADHTPFGFPDDRAFCRHLIEQVGVAAIPVSAFHHNPSDGASHVRFAFCKTEEVLREAVARMATLG